MPSAVESDRVERQAIRDRALWRRKTSQFKIVNGSTTINPNRCYLQLPTFVFAGTRSVDVVYEDEIGDKTGINPSFVGNDQEPAVIYNLKGQRVENPRKGLYIRNGKKVVIK